jgi:hypothetical protein
MNDDYSSFADQIGNLSSNSRAFIRIIQWGDRITHGESIQRTNYICLSFQTRDISSRPELSFIRAFEFEIIPPYQKPAKGPKYSFQQELGVVAKQSLILDPLSPYETRIIMTHFSDTEKNIWVATFLLLLEGYLLYHTRFFLACIMDNSKTLQGSF